MIKIKVFLDSADIVEIEKVKEMGILEGLTTNPSLIKKAAEKYKIKDMSIYIKKILRLCRGLPVSLEVIGSDYKTIVKEGEILYKKFNKVAGNVYVKIPVNLCLNPNCDKASDGIKAIKYFSKKKIPINCTLIFTPEQSMLASKAGASFVSPFVGRMDDYIRETSHIKFDKLDYYPEKGFKKGKKLLNDKGIVSGVDLIVETRKIFDKQKIKKTKILAASIRNKRQFREVAEAGADIATVPFSVITTLLTHPKSSEGMKKFVKDIVPEYKNVLK